MRVTPNRFAGILSGFKEVGRLIAEPQIDALHCVGVQIRMPAKRKAKKAKKAAKTTTDDEEASDSPSSTPLLTQKLFVDKGAFVWARYKSGDVLATVVRAPRSVRPRVVSPSVCCRPAGGQAHERARQAASAARIHRGGGVVRQHQDVHRAKARDFASTADDVMPGCTRSTELISACVCGSWGRGGLAKYRANVDAAVVCGASAVSIELTVVPCAGDVQ